jgi:excisionase family DNA binding protein
MRLFYDNFAANGLDWRIYLATRGREVLTTAQAAALLGVSIRTAQLWLESGKLPSWKTPGGHRRVHRSDVLANVPEATPQSSTSPVVVALADPTVLDRVRRSLAEIGCEVRGFSGIFPATRALVSTGSACAVVIDLVSAPELHLAWVADLLEDPSCRPGIIIAVSDRTTRKIEKLAGDRHRLRILTPRSLRLALPKLIQQSLEGRIALEGSGPALPHYPFPVPANELQRLRVVESIGLLDSPPLPAFDSLTRMAGEMLEMPVSLMTLLARDRQWFQSRQGLAMRETPREWAFCNYTLLKNEILVVNDLARDPRFTHNPAVAHAPSFRFYAGAPYADQEGFPLGSVCVMDYEPRRLDARGRRVLTELAALVADEIRLRQAHRELGRPIP